MKLLAFALCFLSFSISLASKSRLDSLARSPHLIDSQSVFTKPLGVFELDPYVALESGITSVSGYTDGAEGSILVKPTPPSVLHFSIGHQDQLIVTPRLFLNAVAGTSFYVQQSPFQALYGYKAEDTNYVASLSYSKFHDKLNGDSEESALFSAGVEMGALQLFGSYVLLNKAEATSTEFKSAGGGSASVYYSLDGTTFFLTWNMQRPVSAISGVEAESHVMQTGQLGFVDSNVKDERDFFWGGQVITTRVDCKTTSGAECSDSFTRTRVPAWFGIEGHMESWLVLRGSITQNLLIDQIKDEIGYPSAAVPGASGVISEIGAASNSTTVALGAGLKFSSLLVDGSLSGATTQTLDANNFLTQLSVTYGF